ncbi:MAG: histidine phosphatase family protein [Leptonema sp. (in: bacteria)]
MRFFLIRHGETDFNKEFRIQGSIDTELNEVGKLQSKLLAKKIIKYLDSVDHCFISPQKRAKQTAEILLENLQHTTTVHSGIENPLLREIHCGRWEGKLLSEIEKTEKELLQLIRTRTDVSYPDGESILDVRKRAKEFFDFLNSHYDLNSKTTLIISHGNFLRTLASVILDLSPEFAIKIVLHNTGFSLIEEKKNIPKQFKLIFWNNTEHLDSIL